MGLPQNISPTPEECEFLGAPLKKEVWYDHVAKLGEDNQGVPLPTDRDEAWRYTSPRKFIKAFSKAQGGGDASFVSVSGMPKVPDTVGPIDGEIANLLGADLPADAPSRAMYALHQQLVQSVLVVRIPKGLVHSEPVRIRVNPADGKVVATQTIIVVEDGASVEVIQEIEPGPSSESACANAIEVIVKRGASCRYLALGCTSGDYTSAYRLRAHVGRDALFDGSYIAAGGKLSRADIDCFMRESGGQAKVRAISVGEGRRHLDLHTNQVHLAPNCYSELTARSVVSDKSRSVYYGYIRVAEAAHGTDAYQSSRNLLLSADARADTIPNLEILANEVRCSHGASVSRPSEDELFYLQCRGISREDAEALLVSGFIGSVVADVPGATSRAQIERLLGSRLG